MKFVLGKVTCPRQNSIFTQWSRYAWHLLLKVFAADSLFTVGHSALGVLCLFISLQKERIYYSWTKTLVSRAFVLLCCHLELSYFSLVWLKRSSYSNSKGKVWIAEFARTTEDKTHLQADLSNFSSMIERLK